MNYLVVGLGNIGAEYAATRHNMGFMVLDAWAQASNAVFTVGRYGATTEISFKGRKFTLLKPSTYMNLSGKAVRYWLQKTRIPQENLLVVVDDFAIPFGTLRMRKRGSAGGHNGLKSIDYELVSDDYARLRVGTGNGGFAEGHQVDFVLGELLLEEKRMLPLVLERAVEAIKCYGTEGIDRAMTRFNRAVVTEDQSSPSTPSSEKKEP
ncbi:MAG: aminoacyl-tRNA hydrolase [Bacteroidales bacterium]|jgi:PTH1 family peptidyl-tRNA hydrolase|nr:aminoacyl-tRNA hydrolase [Bacteroidales bacterium]MBQ1636577.1 aminoacyl-tRNA hydrolase [Bacteroidales bacterium]MBQ1680083.1 aminoacyl-tRNA hydrolase [Bacteroidales bacterium]MBQ1754706.1 aminoacyl-tRNA hydrolase [Bacteroidales bacterium]MBQ1832010.1 aminoacyl-tRNA hydrolase [Bacteroidales bacterium]